MGRWVFTIKGKTMIDFTKAEIGQEVWHPAYGNGEILTFTENTDTFPVGVRFKSIGVVPYTIDGKELTDELYPTLCVGHREPLDQGALPLSVPKPLVFNGTPVWAYVGEADDYEIKRKRLVIAYHETYLTINAGLSNTKNVATTTYRYAWEIKD